MPMPQAVRQTRYVERSMSPMSNRLLSGAASGGVPKMHPLKTAMKAATLMHGLRLKKFKATAPKLPGLPRLPRIGV